MSSPSEEDPGRPRKPARLWLVAFCLAAVAAVIVGLIESSVLSDNVDGKVAALGTLVGFACAGLTWIVAFPVFWLLARAIRAANKRGADKRG